MLSWWVRNVETRSQANRPAATTHETSIIHICKSVVISMVRLIHGARSLGSVKVETVHCEFEESFFYIDPNYEVYTEKSRINQKRITSERIYNQKIKNSYISLFKKFLD